MVDIQSKEVIDKISDELKVQPAMAIPKALMDKIQLVYAVNAKHIINDEGMSDNFARITSGTMTIFTTPNNRDFFLTNLSASYIKDAACDTATGGYLLSAVINGKTVTLHNFPIITLTAQSDRLVQYFNPPIKLDRGSILTLTGTFTLGVLAREGSVKGFITDPQ